MTGDTARVGSGSPPGGRRGVAGRPPGAVVAAVMIAGLLMLSRAAGWSDLVAVAAAPAVLWACWRGLRPDRLSRAGVVVTAVAACAAVLIWGTHQPPDYQRLIVTGSLLWVAVLTAAMVLGRERLAVLPWVVAGLTVVLTVVMAALEQGEIPLDVWVLHQVAGERLAAGASPWAGLGVDNASRFAPPQAVIGGYPYPLPTLLAYAGAAQALADPRWAGAVAWVGTVGLLAWRVRRAGRTLHADDGRAGVPRGALVALVLLAGAPGWPAVLRNSWTEPLSLLLVVAGLVLWRRSPVASGVLLGVAAVSKQYLLVIPVLLLLAPLPDRRRRLAAAVATAAAVGLAGFALGAGYLDAVVSFHLSQPPRPDSAGLYGLLARLPGPQGWPSWLGPAGGGLVALWLGRRVDGPARFALGLAGSLTVVFALGQQAFPNYWLLVLGLVVAGLVERAHAGARYSASETIASSSSP